MDTISKPLLITYCVIASPVLIPGLALYGAFHGLKAAFVHGIMPGAKKLAAASRKA